MKRYKYDELPESENDKQIVYKINGDFKGDIKGKNITVIVMGTGDIIGDIDCKNGEVVLLNGNIKGDVKADKILCPTEPESHEPAKVKCSNCTFAKKEAFFNAYTCSKYNVINDNEYHDCQGYEPKYRSQSIYHGRGGIMVKCPFCNEIYPQSLTVSGKTLEDGKIALDVKIKEEVKNQ